MITNILAHYPQQYPQRSYVTRPVAIAVLSALLLAVLFTLRPAAVQAAPASDEHSACAVADTLTAVADAWIEQESPSANYGSDEILFVKTHGSIKYRTLVRFDLPTLTDGCVVESVTLRLHAASWSDGRTLRAVALASEWSEDSVNWGNQSDTISDPVLAASGEIVEWDVTSQVQAMIAAGSSYGFQIRDYLEGNASEPQPGFEQQFYSRDVEDSQPQLVISWMSAPDTTPTDTAPTDTTPIDTPAPDTTAPETTLDGTPEMTTTSAEAVFTFSSSEAGSSFECSLDGADFAPCTSPAVYMDLTVGPHTFVVRAIDAAGNADETPASYTWTVENVDEPGDTTNVIEPGNTSGGQEPGGTNGNQEPGGNTGGQEPGDTSGGQEPGDTSGGQEPGDTSGGQEPGDTSGGQEPGDNSSGQEPGDNSGGQEPGESPNAGQGPTQIFLFLPQINN